MLSPLNSRGIALLAITLAWAAFLTIIGSPQVVLFTVPLFLLCAPLALGRYVGEELIVRLASRSRPRRRTARAFVPERFAVSASAVRGSLLLASNMAGRAPPAPACA